jgi:excisionase family DNA binding protein
VTQGRAAERLLTVSEVADILSTTERFPRRLIEERRIRFVRVGRHVRIPESALREFIAAGLVEPITTKAKRRAALWETIRAVAAGSALSAS